jgi:hypothetical protein
VSDSEEPRTDMNALIRAAARQADYEAWPQPQWSTPPRQPRYADIDAAVNGTGMGMGALSRDPNMNAIRDWHRQQGLVEESINDVMREAIAEKHRGRYPGWRMP